MCGCVFVFDLSMCVTMKSSKKITCIIFNILKADIPYSIYSHFVLQSLQNLSLLHIERVNITTSSVISVCHYIFSKSQNGTRIIMDLKCTIKSQAHSTYYAILFRIDRREWRYSSLNYSSRWMLSCVHQKTIHHSQMTRLP